MARDAIPVVAGVVNAATAQGAGVAINTTNGGNLAAAGMTDTIVLIVDHTTVSDKVLTVKAGVYPPAFRQGIGDLALTITASTKQYIFLEAARFVQADGSINVDFASGMTGTCFAVRLPAEAA